MPYEVDGSAIPGLMKNWIDAHSRAKDESNSSEDWARACEAALGIWTSSTWAPTYGFSLSDLATAIFNVLRQSRKPQPLY